MSEPPLDVTVVVTCYNHQAFVEQCLGALAAESRRPAQVVIVDDRSTDDSANVIRSWIDKHDFDAVFLRRGENGGVCRAMNDALDVAEGTYLRHISADDWLEHDQLPGHVETLDAAGEDIAIAVGDIIETDAGGRELAVHDVSARLPGAWGIEGRHRLHMELLKSNRIPAPGVLMRTSAVREIGGYDPTLVFEDWDMWLRLSTRFGAVHHPARVASYRVLDSSLTRSAAHSARFLDSSIRTLRKHSGASPGTDAIIQERLRAFEETLSMTDAQSTASRRRGSSRRASVTRSI